MCAKGLQELIHTPPRFTAADRSLFCRTWLGSQTARRSISTTRARLLVRHSILRPPIGGSSIARDRTPIWECCREAHTARHQASIIWGRSLETALVVGISTPPAR